MRCEDNVNDTKIDKKCFEPEPSSAPSLSPAPSFTSQPSVAIDCTCNSGEFRFELEVRTDFYPGETSWELRNSNEEVVASVEKGGYDKHNHKFNHEYCLSAANNYTFTIFDDGFDGICCGSSGSEGYEGNIHGRTEIFSGDEFEDEETHSFSGEDLCNVAD